MPADQTGNKQGKILEQIVAMLHDYEGVKVETNVKLFPKSGDETRRREIDVLLTSVIAGYPIRVAIQCKNHNKPIEVSMVDAFLGALDDVGIPYQHGIMVSVKGFQAGALARAKEKGVRTLELTGLTDNRLSAEITDAFQYFVYLLPIILSVTIRNNISSGSNSIVFADEKEIYCGYLYELVVNEWRRGKIPSILGNHEIVLPIPKNWFQYSDGVRAEIEHCSSVVKVEGHLIRMRGGTKKFSLINAETRETEKLRIITEFDPDKEEDQITQEIKNGLEMEIVTTDAQLTNLITNKSGLSVIHRLRLPRAYTSACFHPVSERVMQKLLKDHRNFTADDLNQAQQLDFAETEGNIDGSIHEKPWFGFPVIVEDFDGGYIDLRLSLRNREYSKVLKFRGSENLHPTPEFADAIASANRELGNQILGKS